jgi:23S rRNA (adenine2030-N6)-methyltransferase
MLSYQHAFHAGNRADVFKHAVLAAILHDAVAGSGPILYVDTHSGRADYDLATPEARKKAEHEAGIVPALALAAPDPALAPWLNRVRAYGCGPSGLARYPGSPRLAALHLRPTDRMVFFERHPAEHAALARAFTDEPRARVVHGDGFAGSLTLAPRRGERLIIHIDPSYETADDMTGLLSWIERAARRWQNGLGVVVWLPHFRDGREAAFIAALDAHPDSWLCSVRWPAGTAPAGSSLTGSAMWLWGLSPALRTPCADITHALEALWAGSATGRAPPLHG